MAIPIRNKKEISLLQNASHEVGLILEYAKSIIKEGLSLKELDFLIEEKFKSRGVRPAFKGLYGFPNAACISVNEVIIHGIPSEYILKNGDIVGVDIGSEIDGWYGDGAFSIGVGEITPLDSKLLACSFEALVESIESIKVGMHFKELSYILEDLIRSRGFLPLHNYCGHGIGKKPHCEPEIPNYIEFGNVKSGPKIKEGMVFCIEPMVCQKSSKPAILADNWSVASEDGLNGSHHEHTVAIIDGKARILTH